MKNIAEMMVQEEPLSHRKWGRSGTRTGDNGINDAQGVGVTRTGAGEHPTIRDGACLLRADSVINSFSSDNTLADQ